MGSSKYNLIRKIKDDSYKTIDVMQYYKEFGIIVKGKSYAVDTLKEEEKIKEAYNKACHNRDFEIDKFWSRAAYFWGFIVLIFTAYFTVFTTYFAILNSKEAIHQESIEFYKFLIICLNCSGLLFSVAWLLAIIGSKHWQKNWETHIDYLEDFVTGPLFKTIHFKKDFYSVTRVNQFLAWVVIIFWFGILYFFLKVGNHLPGDKNASNTADAVIIWPIIATLILLITLILYSYKSFLNEKGGFIRRDSPTPPPSEDVTPKG